MKYYKYAGNPSCGCCEDPCPYIQLDRCNFNEYCNTSGEEWIENDYGTQSDPDKQCELWYTQSATISLKNAKTGAVDKGVWIDGFSANVWDTKNKNSGQTRADGDTFVITHTITLGSHTIVFSEATEWIYDSGTSVYHSQTKVGVYIDGNCYWTDELEDRGDSSTPASYVYNLVLYRRGNYVDVYTDSGNRWVWSFADSTSNTFTYAFQAVYTGSTKYICVTPNLTWRTVKYKPDSGCVYYPPGTLTQAQIKDIETHQRLSFENNPDCRYTSGTFCPVFSPTFGILLSNIPSEYSSCPTLYRPVYVARSVYGTVYANPFWEIQKTSYCFDSGIGKRINLAVEYVSTVRAVNNCSNFPYSFTIDYYELATESAGLSIVTAPQYGTASVVEDLDGNNEVYMRRIRYTAPSSLPTGTCIDWLEYQLTGQYGETSRGVLKFKLYNEDYTQSEIWEDYLFSPSEGIVSDSDYYQQCLKLTITGERADVGMRTTQTEEHWGVELYGVLPHGVKTYTDLAGITFSYFTDISRWAYQCGNIGDTGDLVESNGDISIYQQDGRYQCYLDAKAMLEAITAQITTRYGGRTTKFVVSNNNIIDSCSTQAIDSTTTTIGIKLVKTNVYTVSSGSGSTTTRTELDSETLQNQTVVVDWGVSPAESPLGLIIPTDQPLTIDVSQYYSRFNINAVPLNIRIRIGLITTETNPTSGVLWTGNNQSGTTIDGHSWQSYDEVKAEIQDSTSTTYF